MPYYHLFYHFVWSTKNRLPLITRINREPIYAAIVAKVDELGGIVHALNGIADHVHLVTSVPPRIALSVFIGQVKGASSHVASQLTSALEPFGWQDEYGALSVSESHLPGIIRYVELQQHHHDQTLDPRLENCT